MKKRNIYYWTLTISAWSAIIIFVVAFISIIAGASIQNIPIKTALVCGVVAIVYHWQSVHSSQKSIRTGKQILIVKKEKGKALKNKNTYECQ